MSYAYVVQMDIPQHLEADFNRIYDEEHVPLRLAVPGFLNARRYKAAEANWPRYLALYDLESVDVLKTSQYARLAKERAMEREIRVHPTDLVFVDTRPHVLDRLPPVPRVDDQFGHERVVVRRHERPRGHAAVHADARSARLSIAHDASGRREEVSDRVFRVHAALDRMAMPGELGLRDLETVARGDSDLLSDQVHPGDHLGDWVLDLETGVDLVEGEATVVQQELDRASVAVSDRSEPPNRGIDQAGAQPRVDGG